MALTFSNCWPPPAGSDPDRTNECSSISDLQSATTNERESPVSARISDKANRMSLSTLIGSQEEAMDPPLPPAREDISVLMAQVLDRMNRIVEHLRAKGEPDAANGIAKSIISIVKTFNDTTVQWDMEMSLIPSSAAPSPQTWTDSDNVQFKKSSPKNNSNNTCTWAAIAAVAPAVKTNLIKFTPRDTIQSRYVENSPQIDAVDADKRVVWVRGWKEGRPLGDITKNVGQGPIYSIAFSPKDASVCVIFQYASSAKALFDDDEQRIRIDGESKFGEGCSVAMGLTFPGSDDITRMANPHNERRRLTFARQQLFTHGMSEARFKADIYSIVGAANVELVWLFNTGNATVVFSAVPLARLVRDEFIRYSRQYNSPYRDVHITFSHDPCERPMSLIKQMPAGRDYREGMYGGDSALPSGVNPNDALTSHRELKDSDGWQTVGRKR